MESIDYKKESQTDARPLLSTQKRGQIQGQGPKRIGDSADATRERFDVIREATKMNVID